MVLRDRQSKKALIRYMKRNPSQRLSQCIINFMKEEMDTDFDSLYAGKQIGNKSRYEDIFYWECDEKLRN